MRSPAKQTDDDLPLSVDPIDQAFLRVAVGLMLAGSAGFIAVALSLGPEQQVRALGGMLLGAIALAAGILLHRDRSLAAVKVLAYGMWAVVSFMTVIGGGLRTPIVIAYPALIAMGGWLLGTPAAAVLTGLTLAMTAGLFAGEAFGWLPAIAPAPAGILWTVDAMVLVSTAALTVYATRSHRAMYRRRRELTESALAKAEALAAGEARMRLVTENVPALIAYYGGDQRCRYANRRYADFFGIAPDEIVGKALGEIVGQDVLPTIAPHLRQALAGKSVRYAGTRRSPRHGVREMEISLVPNREADGEVAGYFVMILDVTEQHQAAQALRLSETKFAKIFSSSPVPISLARFSDGRFVDINPAFESLFGWTRDELVGRTSTEVGVWKSPEERLRWTRELRESGRTRSFEVDWRNKSGEQRLCQISAEIVQIDGEDYILALTYDISERKAAEQALRVGEERLRLATASGGVGIWEWDVASGRLEWNAQLKAIFGLPDDAEGLSLDGFIAAIHPDDLARVQRDYMLALEHRSEFNCEYRIVRPDGSIHWIVARGQGRYDGAGQPLRMVGTAIDVTGRRQAETALRESEARLREAQRIGHFGSWELDLARDAFFWSGEIDVIFETSAPQGRVNYATFLDMVHPDDRAAFDQAFRQSIAAGSAAEITYRLRMPDGRVKHVHVRAETRLGPDGTPVASIGTTQDITEQELARQEIRRLNTDLEKRVQERTAELTAANRELESFAYSISHDLRAPLRGIDGFSQLLADEYRDRLDAQGVDYLDRVRRAAQRMGTLIDDILELSRVTRQEMRRVKVDLGQIAAELIEERSRAEPGHRVAVSLIPDGTVFGDPQLLRVMMQNLLENAWKYSSKEAAPAIEFGRESNGGETVFYVRDNGVGFDMKYADRLFAPFQRLHKPEEFEGTGIGLATVARVVHRHGGRIWAEAAPGKGAVFRFTLA